MLTVDYNHLGVRAGDRLLDLGCGAGRHAFEAFRRGANVVALDYSDDELCEVRALFQAMADAGEGRADGSATCSRGDACRLPFPDDRFDRVIASEVFEHVPDDVSAYRELARVLRPGGTIAITVPACLPERVCWALSDEYHAPFVEGGHVRIYTEAQVRERLTAAGLEPGRSARAHALHAPYWWLRCAVGPTNDRHPLVRAYHQLLVWDISGTPVVSNLTRFAERTLNPVLGKSLVVYATKTARPSPRRAADARSRAAIASEAVEMAASTAPPETVDA